MLPYSIMFKTFVKKPTIMRQTKKKTEESFKLFTKPRREMAITIKKKNQTDLFLEKASPPYFKKKRKKIDLMSLSAPVKK